MPKKEYNWRNGPAELEPHSLAKHTILRNYIEEYLRILTKSGKVPEFRVTLIDGFAGGGEYVVKGGGGTIHEGSPLILVNAVRAAMARINDGREKPVDIDAEFVFVERNPVAHEYLKQTLCRKLGNDFVTDKIQLFCDAFENRVWDIVAKIKSTAGRKPRPIFVLDQYGYSGIPVDMIKRIMRELPHAEIFLTLAVDYIADYSSSLQDAVQRLKSSLHVDTGHVEAILDRRKDVEEVETLPEEHRHQIMLQIQWILHDAFAQRAGALYYTPFFITSAKSRKSYWFLHLANSSRANDVVKQLHWNVANHFEHHGRPGTSMMVLGVDPSRPPKSQLSFDFGITAQESTVEALLEELPERLREEKYRNGVSINALYEDLCNETPASKEVLKLPIDDLVSAGVLEKVGVHGEERRVTTHVRDNDKVRLARTGLLFSLPQLRTPEHLRKKR